MKEFLSTIPMHMNLMVIYFFLLPFFLILSISFAKQKKYKLHFISQTFLLSFSFLVIIYFEIMIRLEGGFFEFIKDSTLSHTFLVTYLIVHILISITALILWIRLFVKSYKMYKIKKFEEFKSSNHKKMGKITFIFLFLSCITGVLLYFFLFLL